MIKKYVETRNMLTELKQNKKDEGATMVEYGLIVAAIALVVVVGAGVFGDELSAFFENLSSNL